MRFLYLEWRIAPWPGNANTIKNSLPTSIVFYPNGTQMLVPGDIITENGFIQNSVGHTAIITNVSLDDRGTGTISILEQHASSAGIRPLSVINWQVQPDAWCFGQTIQGWLHVKTNSNLVTTISAGMKNACWVQGDGTLACWGDNTYGQSTSPSGTFAQVSTGYYHTCGLMIDGTIACWGDNTYGQAAPPAGTFTQFSSGYAHTCGLKSDGTLACWGSNANGRATPPVGIFLQVSAGYAHTCGLMSNGTVACWGSNTYGQATPPAGTFAQVSAGYAHTCGLKSDGSVICWGNNANGQATPPSGTFIQVSAGYKHTCGLKSDDTVACWGANLYGQASPPAGTFAQVSAGYTNTCGLKSDDSVVCWGDNTYGQTAPFSISGNAGIGGATLNYSDGKTKTVTAASDGSYSLAVSYGWSGMVTPSLTDYTFSPANRTYTDVTANTTSQNYTALVTITGNAGDAGVVLQYTNVTTMTVTSGTKGLYTITVPYGWLGAVLPTKTGITFKPASRTYPGLIANQTAQNYTDTVTFTTTGVKDGWILESAQASGVGGSMNSSSTTFQLGDDASNSQYRGILSFNTASLPDTAIIKSAVLKIYQSGAAIGNNPFSVLGSLYADIKKGCFGSSSALQLADFNAVASGGKVGTFGKTPVKGWYSATVNSSGLSNINKTSLTQFRLYFSIATNANKQADYMQFLSGDASSGQPQLIITYTLP